MRSASGSRNGAAASKPPAFARSAVGLLTRFAASVVPPRLGLSLDVHDTLPAQDLLRPALVADALGYELALVPEAWGHDGFVLLGYLAARTSRIRIGPGIVNVYSRSAAQLAMAAATLDELTGGRSILGLGVSGKAVIEGWHGTPMGPPLERLREVTLAIRAVHARDKRGFQGTQVTVAPGFMLRTEPVRSDLAIFHASIAPAAIRQCGEIADGWIPTVTGAERLRENAVLIAEGLERSHRTRGAFTIAPNIPTLVLDDLAAARAVMRRQLAFYIGGMGRFYYEAINRQGYTLVTEVVRRLWSEKRRDAAAAEIPDELVDQLTVCGPRDRCLATLQRFRDAGADLPVVTHSIGSTMEQFEATLRALAPSAQ